MDEDALDRGWHDLLARWEDGAAHARLLAAADAAERLPELARRYRAEKEAGGARAAIAEERLAAITARALGHLSSSKRDETPRRSRLEWIALGVSVALGTAALWQLARVL